MSSMKELYPLHGFPKKPQRNFVRENIKKAKGCSQCLAEKNTLKTNYNRGKHKNEPLSNSLKCCQSENDVHLPAMKYNIRIVKRGKSPENDRGNRYQSHSSINTHVSCQTCGQPVNRKENRTKQPLNGNMSNESSQKDEKEPSESVKDYHKLSHENKDQKEALAKKSLDLSAYKKGEVPRYLKERNVKLMQELQNKEEREKLAHVMGLDDPACPPGHMLMPLVQLEENITVFESKYQSLILELNKMPVSNDSLRIRRRKIEIEKELKDLEEKIEFYKTKKVFIKIPD